MENKFAWACRTSLRSHIWLQGRQAGGASGWGWLGLWGAIKRPKKICNFEYAAFLLTYEPNERVLPPLFFHRINVFEGLFWKINLPGPVGPHYGLISGSRVVRPVEPEAGALGSHQGA